MIRIYTDGACGKDGVGGWAWILTRDDKPICGDLGRAAGTTNQRMELVAAGAALAWVPTWLDVTVVSDSAYLVNCFEDEWYVKWRDNGWLTPAKKPVENQEVWKRLLAVVEGRQGPTRWLHVKGHNGDRFNELCDQLAVHARRA